MLSLSTKTVYSILDCVSVYMLLIFTNGIRFRSGGNVSESSVNFKTRRKIVDDFKMELIIDGRDILNLKHFKKQISDLANT